MFPDIKTRRLGVRGQSKYHYCGIKLVGEAMSPRSPKSPKSSRSSGSVLTLPTSKPESVPAQPTSKAKSTLLPAPSMDLTGHNNGIPRLPSLQLRPTPEEE